MMLMRMLAGENNKDNVLLAFRAFWSIPEFYKFVKIKGEGKGRGGGFFFFFFFFL